MAPLIKTSTVPPQTPRTTFSMIALTRKRKRILLYVASVAACAVVSVLHLIFAVIPQESFSARAMMLHQKSVFQPRAATAALYSYLNEKIRHKGPFLHPLGSAEGIVFHWDDWVDLTAGDPVLSETKRSNPEGSCPESLIRYASVNPYFTESYYRKILRSMAYAYCIKDTPAKVLATTDSGYVVVPVAGKERVGQMNLPRDVSKKQLVGQMERLEHVLEQDDFQTQLSQRGLGFIPHSAMRKVVDVESADFVYNVEQEILALKDKVEEGVASKAERDILVNLQLGNEMADTASMFFKYPSIFWDFVARRSHHFYFPYFKRLFGDRERQSVLQHLIRAWFRFAETEKVASWVNYGSLLGWAFNGVNMPWDTDVDVQLPIAHLHRMALKHNNTIIVENPRDGNGVYLFEVSPTYVRQGNGKNFIDARLIDVNTGLYIDISAVSHTHHKAPSWMSQQHDIASMPVHCKHWNWHLLQEILPIRHTFLEGSSVYIPHNVTSILDRKYGRSSYTATTSFKRHQYREDLLMWVPDDVCRPERDEVNANDVLGSILAKCGSSWLSDEYRIVSPCAKRRAQLNDLEPVSYDYRIDDLPLLRKDHWEFYDDLVQGRETAGEWYNGESRA